MVSKADLRRRALMRRDARYADNITRGWRATTRWSMRGDYIPHHEPFMYYPQTTNVHHTRPSSVSLIGTSSDGANHQYDLTDFFCGAKGRKHAGGVVLKAGAYQDGHAGYSDPIDEQIFVVNTINAIMQSPFWRDTAIVIAWDDSDGWYDHQMGTIVNQSNVSDDQLLGPGNCGTPKAE